MTTGTDLRGQLADLTEKQADAERKMLGCMAQSSEEFLSTWASWESPVIPVQLRREYMDFFSALAMIHEELREPVTESRVDQFLDYFECEAALAAGGGSALLSWVPSDGSAADFAAEVSRISQQRWQVGQRIWPESLYRWYDADRQLLYVGISADLGARQSAHARRSSWSQFAYACTVERYPERNQVEWAERRAIAEEQPLFNRQHNDTPEARERLVSYLVDKGRLDLLAPAISRG